MIKSNPVRGVVYNLCRRALSRSFAINVAEKSVINDSPNTVIPGVSVLISNKFTGIFACKLLKSSSNTSGNPRPKQRLMGSRKISLVQRLAKVIILIGHPSSQWKQTLFQNQWFQPFCSILLPFLPQEDTRFS